MLRRTTANAYSTRHTRPSSAASFSISEGLPFHPTSPPQTHTCSNLSRRWLRSGFYYAFPITRRASKHTDSTSKEAADVMCCCVAACREADGGNYVVMNSLLPNAAVDELYDLKGCADDKIVRKVLISTLPMHLPPHSLSLLSFALLLPHALLLSLPPSLP